MSVGIVDKSTGDRIQTAGNPLDKVGDLTNLTTTAKDNAVAAINEVNAGLAGKQDTLTFDSVPTNGSTNPVESNGVHDALALKQNATDNSLDTDAKTIVGAINENAGDIGSLKSGFTTLDNEVNGDATVYPYADVVTIEDAVPANLADCNVKIEPDQNLHGYANPWVGGAGKNKLPLVLADIKTANTDGTWNGNVYTINGGMFTVYTDDGGNVTKIVANGTFSIRSTLRLRTSNDNYALTQGSYIVSKGFTNSSVGIAIETFNGTTWVSRLTASTSTDNVSFTVDYDGYDRLYVYLEVTNTSSAVNETFYPMIRLATETDSTFAPYTNYCPISGHTEASVKTEGKNLFDRSNAIVSGWNVFNIPNTLKKNTTYTYSVGGTTSINFALFLTNSTTSSSGNFEIAGYRGKGGSKTFTTPSNTEDYAYLMLGGSTTIGNNFSDATFQVELGEKATEHVPYAGKTYTIALGDTIYGGKVRIDSNGNTVMDVDRVKFTPTSTTDIGKNTAEWPTNQFVVYPSESVKANGFIISDRFKTIDGGSDVGVFVNSNGRIRVNTTTSYQSASDALAGEFASSEFCYELATPTTIQLTPQQIQLLKGQNTLTASTGQISVTVNGVSGSIGAVQEQANATDAALAELADKLPTAPTTDGTYTLTVTVADGTPTYSWESAT